ncbi:TPA: hypothetical protein ACH9UQ_002697, partial [Escherichia coli]
DQFLISINISKTLHSQNSFTSLFPAQSFRRIKNVNIFIESILKQIPIIVSYDGIFEIQKSQLRLN